MNYLDGYSPVLPEALLKEARPPDVDLDLLPFEFLGWRRFELLVYLLKMDLRPEPGARVEIMSGTGDQGCDILTCAADGTIETIAQCKNHREPLTAKDIATELVKVELFLSRRQLEGSSARHVLFELWAPRFANTAIELVAEWPRRWNTTLAKSAFNSARSKYAAFRKLRWKDVAAQLQDGLPQRFSVQRYDGRKITELVRTRPALTRQFFQVSTVVPLEDAQRLLHENEATTTERLLRILRDRNYRPIDADDLRHIYDIISSVPEERRFFLGHGYCCGIDGRTHQAMTADERTEFLGHTLTAVHGPAQVTLSVATRASFASMRLLRFASPQPSGALVYVIHRFLADSLQIRFRRLVTPRFMQSEIGIPPSDPRPTAEALESLATTLWRELQSGVPLLSADDPDLPLRVRIIDQIIGDTRSEEDFVRAVQRDFTVHKQLVFSIQDELLDMIPERLVVVSDSFDVNLSDDGGVQRWMNSIHQMSSSSREQG